VLIYIIIEYMHILIYLFKR